ncbi:hypothetical protein NLJ89_g11165 [Agrocybe chaxingu]|uniref:Uncharacterized protein n=1 Tax=Agrocybe chaxingu TaxID=84603 RepID=A0A9W8JQH1_9AGAR|nr:hypothetical protein NLJ89_g11165 [Agrocybe chaxingu]
MPQDSTLVPNVSIQEVDLETALRESGETSRLQTAVLNPKNPNLQYYCKTVLVLVLFSVQKGAGSNALTGSLLVWLLALVAVFCSRNDQLKWIEAREAALHRCATRRITLVHPEFIHITSAIFSPFIMFGLVTLVSFIEGRLHVALQHSKATNATEVVLTSIFMMILHVLYGCALMFLLVANLILQANTARFRASKLRSVLFYVDNIVVIAVGLVLFLCMPLQLGPIKARRAF